MQTLRNAWNGIPMGVKVGIGIFGMTAFGRAAGVDHTMSVIPDTDEMSKKEKKIEEMSKRGDSADEIKKREEEIDKIFLMQPHPTEKNKKRSEKMREIAEILQGLTYKKSPYYEEGGVVVENQSRIKMIPSKRRNVCIFYFFFLFVSKFYLFFSLESKLVLFPLDVQIQNSKRKFWGPDHFRKKACRSHSHSIKSSKNTMTRFRHLLGVYIRMGDIYVDP
jgi:hypothetical protein